MEGGGRKGIQLADGCFIPSDELRIEVAFKASVDITKLEEGTRADRERVVRSRGRVVTAIGGDKHEARENLGSLLSGLLDIAHDTNRDEPEERIGVQGGGTCLIGPDAPKIREPSITLANGVRICSSKYEIEPVVKATLDVAASRSLNEHQKHLLIHRNANQASTVVTGHAETEDRALSELESIVNTALKSLNSLWQALSLWGPAAIALFAASVLGILDIPDLNTGDLRRLASLCASLLIAGLAGTGIVAALGLRTETASVDASSGSDQDPSQTGSATHTRRGSRRVSKIMRVSQLGAGIGILVSLLLTCAAIVAGGLATPSSLTNFICISGLVAAVLQIFAAPASLAVARLGHQPFLLDELAL